MDIDPVSGFLGLMGFFLGLLILVDRLKATRNIDVTCMPHDQRHM
jgi:hypothetical protein